MTADPSSPAGAAVDDRSGDGPESAARIRLEPPDVPSHDEEDERSTDALGGLGADAGDDAAARVKVRKAPNAFRTISEVADDLHIPQHVLRFWETKFHQVKPMKRGGGRRSE